MGRFIEVVDLDLAASEGRGCVVIAVVQRLPGQLAQRVLSLPAKALPLCLRPRLEALAVGQEEARQQVAAVKRGCRGQRLRTRWRLLLFSLAQQRQKLGHVAAIACVRVYLHRLPVAEQQRRVVGQPLTQAVEGLAQVELRRLQRHVRPEQRHQSLAAMRRARPLRLFHQQVCQQRLGLGRRQAGQDLVGCDQFDGAEEANVKRHGWKLGIGQRFTVFRRAGR